MPNKKSLMKAFCIFLMLFFSALVTPASAVTIKIGMFGDSVTAGGQEVNGVLYHTTDITIPVLVDYMLELRFPGHDFSVLNAGKGGTQLYEMYYANRSYGATFDASLASQNFDIVTIDFGLNDASICGPAEVQANPGNPVCGPLAAKHVGPPPRVQVAPLAWRSLLKAAIQTARNRGAVPVVVEMHPTTRMTIPGYSWMHTYVYQTRRAAIETNTPLVGIFDTMRADGNWPYGYHSDPINPGDHVTHLNLEGQAFVARRIVNTLIPIVEGMI